MTKMERQAVAALSNCSFLPGCFEKRITRLWKEKMDRAPREPMTDKGRACLWRLVYRYRRQIGDEQLIAFAARKNRVSDKTL